MKILACIDFEKQQITQAWELVERDPSPYLVISHPTAESMIAIRLERSRIQDLKTGSEIADKTYLGSLSISEAQIIS